MRLIDADKLEARFESLATIGNNLAHKITDEEKERKVAYELAKYETHVAPTITPEILQPQWISVTERLPKMRKDIDSVDREIHYVSDLVMVTVRTINGNRFVPDDCLADGEWANYPTPRFNVIAWMPLPEPYYRPWKNGDSECKIEIQQPNRRLDTV